MKRDKSHAFEVARVFPCFPAGLSSIYLHRAMTQPSCARPYAGVRLLHASFSAEGRSEIGKSLQDPAPNARRAISPCC